MRNCSRNVLNVLAMVFLRRFLTMLSGGVLLVSGVLVASDNVVAVVVLVAVVMVVVLQNSRQLAI